MSTKLRVHQYCVGCRLEQLQTLAFSIQINNFIAGRVISVILVVVDVVSVCVCVYGTVGCVIFRGAQTRARGYEKRNATVILEY